MRKLGGASLSSKWGHHLEIAIHEECKRFSIDNKTKENECRSLKMKVAGIAAGIGAGIGAVISTALTGPFGLGLSLAFGAMSATGSAVGVGGLSATITSLFPTRLFGTKKNNDAIKES